MSLASLRTVACWFLVFIGVVARGQELGSNSATDCQNPGVTPMSERVSKSELTRNFIALTVYAPAPGAPFRRVAEIEQFPGWTDQGEPVLDSDGGWIYAFEHDESGVGASYFWLLRRAQFTDPKLLPTPRQIAYSMAGVHPSRCSPDLQPTPEGLAAWAEAAPRWCGRVARYLDEWLALARHYYHTPPGPDDVLDFRDPDQLWQWMQVMYHHESGRTPVVDRATFDRGVRLATDFISAGDRLERPITDYLHPCGPTSGQILAEDSLAAEPATPPLAGPPSDYEELMQILGTLDAMSATLAVMQRQVDDLRGRVEALAREVR